MNQDHVGTSFALSDGNFVEALAKGFAVLESFDTERQRIDPSVAAKRTGITRAAARRHLLTLASLGYLESDGKYFWLTPKVLRLSGSYLATARLPRLLQPTLDRLALRIGEALAAVVLDGDEVVIIGLSGPTRLLAYGLHLGARLPAHATSTGRVLLANLSRNGLDAWLKGKELARLTPKTVVDPKTLRDVLEKARQDDFCVADEEHEMGVTAVAVPVRDLHGRAVTALNVVLTSRSDLTPDRLRELVFHLQEGARELRGLL
ncbi:MAG: IclR family transcriptional regulator [Comamonadaceae bacterium]|nr:MAG: IclR family transcriptional regulator [Comamonadaceae bacterium]